MNIVFILAPLSLLLAGVFVYFFFRAVRSGQFEDLDTPAHRALFENQNEKKDIRKENENVYEY